MNITSRYGQSFQRFIHNFAAYGFGQVINIVIQFFSIPLFLHYWSKEEYGEWLVLTSIPSLLWTLDNSLAGLAGSRMTVFTAKGDWEQANQIFRNVMTIQNALGILVFAITVLVVNTCNISAIFGFTHLSRSQADRVLLLMMGYLVIAFYMGFPRAAYRASMLEARAVVVGNCCALSGFVITVIVLTLGGHPVEVACGLLGCFSFWVIFMFIDVRRRCPKIDFAFGLVSFAQTRRTFADGVPILAGQAAGAFFLQGYPLVVNHLLGPVWVVTLTTLRTASRTLFQGVQIVSMASSAELSRTYGNKDWEGYLRLVKVLLAVTIWSAVGAGVGLTVFGPWVIAKWTSGKVVVDHTIMFLFALSVAFQCGWSACNFCLVSTNMHHSFNYIYLCLTLAGLCLVNILEHAFGFMGVPLTMVIIDGLLLGWALHICRTKLTFMPLGSLSVVFQPSFYAGKAEHFLKRKEV